MFPLVMFAEWLWGMNPALIMLMIVISGDSPMAGDPNAVIHDMSLANHGGQSIDIDIMDILSGEADLLQSLIE
jgi:hypothetical protein